MSMLRTYKRLFVTAEDSLKLRRATSLAQKACKICNRRLQPVLGVIMTALCAVYTWAAVDAAAVRI